MQAMEEIYKNIKNALINFVPEIKWIEMDEGQLDNYTAGEEPLTYPCALISIDENIDYKNIAGGKQIARSNFYIRFAFRRFESTSAKVPEPYANKAFEPYTIAKKAMAVINHEIINCTRISFNRENKTDPLVFRSVFKIAYLDKEI